MWSDLVVQLELQCDTQVVERHGPGREVKVLQDDMEEIDRE